MEWVRVQFHDWYRRRWSVFRHGQWVGWRSDGSVFFVNFRNFIGWDTWLLQMRLAWEELDTFLGCGCVLRAEDDGYEVNCRCTLHGGDGVERRARVTGPLKSVGGHYEFSHRGA